MAKSKKDINYLYIWKKLNGQISDKEDEYLANWRNEYEGNEHIFQMFAYFHKNKKSILSKPVHVDSAYSKIQYALKKKLRQKVYLRFGLVGAAVVLIGLIVSGIFSISKKEVQQPIPIAEVNILPGQKQATLVLNDGSLHKLDDKKNLEIEEENTVIRSSGKSLTYETRKRKNKGNPYNTLIVPRGAEFFITLSDSTKVWLNSETTLRYPVSFSGEKREVELIGEAYFEVTEDANRPFRVISNDHVIQVLGTAFNLSSFESQTNIRTTLVEGKIVIENIGDTELSLELEPGQQAIFNKHNKNTYQHKVDVSLFTSWKDGRFKFKNAPLHQIMETFSRWYAIDVTFENELARDLEFTGVLKRHQNFEDIIPILERTNDLKIVAYEKKIVVK